MHFRSFSPALILAVLSSCSQTAPSLEDRKERIEAIAANASVLAMERKARSDTRLESEGVPVNRDLPAIEDVGEMKLRTKEEIAWRAMALLVVAVKGEGLDQATVEEIVKGYGLEAHFTPDETAFIKQLHPTDHDRIQFSWRYEAAWTLLWALGYVERLGKPTDTCDVPRAVAFLKERTSAQFISDSKLRPIESIADEADLIYRYHWAVVDARINNRPSPASIDSGVTKERHYALNWLIGYMDQEWDQISTDT